MPRDQIQQRLRDMIGVKEALLADAALIATVSEIVGAVTDALRAGGKILFCGNGGSAADAQHLAGELSARFYRDREPLFAEALHVNSSYLTAVANDYDYSETFARALAAKGRGGDVLVALSTSGRSANILRAVDRANEIDVVTIGMTGQDGGELRERCRYLLAVPSTDTPRIQECHVALGHIICELVEAAMFPEAPRA